MVTCTTVTRDVLPNPVTLKIGEKLDFKSAKALADAKAVDLLAEPMLMGWYDSETGRFSPNVECCSEEKPGWVVYAESRGGRISIDINDLQYVFIYRDCRE